VSTLAWVISSAVGVSGAVNALVVLAARRFVTSKIDGAVRLQVETQLAQRQHELDVVAETHRKGLKAEHDIQMATLQRVYSREHAAFQRYTARQHSVYRKLYFLLREAERKLSHAAAQLIPEYQAWSPKKLETHVRALNIPDDEFAVALTLLAKGPQGLDAFRAYLHRAAQVLGSEAFNAANGYAVTRELYLSDPVRAATTDILEALAIYRLELISAASSRGVGDHVPPMFGKLADLMREEMRGASG
jgi:hypothetical protein